ncbi:MAG: hypothetical protein Ct9H300mP7_4170 [Verrucomicrobiota bacterium]|nr:MAG: hypothetical protein Ct9H300mP7_4170 [Verrucomicrobiota bacterium]
MGRHRCSPVNVITRLERHYNFLERGVSGAFTNTVDGALDLPRTGIDGNKRVGHGKAKVVVTMTLKTALPDWNSGTDSYRCRINSPNCPGTPSQLYPGCSPSWRRHQRPPGNLDEEIRLGTGSILGRELDIGDKLAARFTHRRRA